MSKWSDSAIKPHGNDYFTEWLDTRILQNTDVSGLIEWKN